MPPADQQRQSFRSARTRLRAAGQSGASVWPREHEVGSARRCAESVPRSERPRVGLRRTSRGASAEARGWRLPRPILIGRPGSGHDVPCADLARDLARRRQRDARLVGEPRLPDRVLSRLGIDRAIAEYDWFSGK